MDAVWLLAGLGWTESGWTAANGSVYANRDMADATTAIYSGRNASHAIAAGGLDPGVSGSDAGRATGADQKEDRRTEEIKK